MPLPEDENPEGLKRSWAFDITVGLVILGVVIIACIL